MQKVEIVPYKIKNDKDGFHKLVTSEDADDDDEEDDFEDDEYDE